MTVSDVQFISDNIVYLRANIYPSVFFIDSFSENIKSTIYAMDIDFQPDPYGGWNISVVVNRNKCTENGIDHNSYAYIKQLIKSLKYAIECVHPHDQSILALDDEIFGLNMFNVVLTGPDSIVIKL